MAGPGRVVIAGAGYAGLAAYLALRPAARAGRIRVTIVNADNWHLLLPELPLYLSGEEPASDLRLDLRRAVQPPAELVIGRIDALDVHDVAVSCGGHRVGGDALLLALGSVPSDFGVPGVAEHALAIGRWHDVQALRHRLLDDLQARQRSSVAVVGAGFTGVEIAAALADRAQQGGSGLHVALVGDRILPSMPDAVRRVATDALHRLDVRLVPGRAVAVEAGTVRLQGGGACTAETIVWAAGVRANPLLGIAGLAVNGRGQARVDAHLRAAPHVFCAGDCAAVADPRSGRDASPTAQLALQEGPAAAANALRDIEGRPLGTFEPRERGFLVSLGRGDAAGTIGRLAVHGSEVAALKRLIEHYHAFQVGGLQALARALLRGGRAREPAAAGTLAAQAPASGRPAPESAARQSPRSQGDGSASQWRASSARQRS
jgi:NADH dehydrogenase